jgi:hypothetical protein
MSGTGRTLVVVSAIAALLALVAVASGGGTPLGSGGGRRPSEWLVDVAISLLLVWMAVGAVLWIVVLVLRPQELADPTAMAGRRRSRIGGAVVLVGLLLLAVVGARRLAPDDATTREGTGGAGDSPLDALDERGDRYEPEFATVPVLIVVALAAVAVAALLLARQRRRRRPVEAGLVEALAEALEETLDDLHAERDPRRAVIAAYVRFEQILAAHGVPRRPSEAPEEYLARALRSLELPRASVARLTALFETAKFSLHDVDAGMKEEAIRAVSQTLDELRAARERAEAERARAIELARGAAS